MGRVGAGSRVYASREAPAEGKRPNPGTSGALARPSCDRLDRGGHQKRSALAPLAVVSSIVPGLLRFHRSRGGFRSLRAEPTGSYPRAELTPPSSSSSRWTRSSFYRLGRLQQRGRPEPTRHPRSKSVAGGPLLVEGVLNGRNGSGGLHCGEPSFGNFSSCTSAYESSL